MDPNAAGRAVDSPTFSHFLEDAALWRRSQLAASDVVDAAVQALLAGVESPSFVLIAGLSKAAAEAELGELLPVALDELGIDALGAVDPNNDLLAAAALAHRFLRGQLEPKQLTELIHRLFGHSCDPLVERLSRLDDAFDNVEYAPNSAWDQLVIRTHTAATVLVDRANEIYASTSP